MHEYVLSNREIITLKRYIEQKHQHPAPHKRAAILANTVHRIVEARLPDFPPEVKRQLRSELLLKHSDSLPIQAEDVYEQCMSLDLSKEELLLPLVSWVSKQSEQADDPLPEEQVRSAILSRYQQVNPAIHLQQAERDERRFLARSSRLSKPIIAAAGTLAAVLAFILIAQLPLLENRQRQQAVPIEQIHAPVAEPVAEPPADKSGIPEKLRYAPVDTERLRDYLQSRNSILAEDSYMNAIIEAGEEYDIHPLLLFAITGQEQALVPKDRETAKTIGNNPFNVYGSWERYNTTIDESSRIAAKTVANASSRRPENTHPIQWLNQTYAEDPNWWTGVSWFFDTLLREVSDDAFEWQ